MIIVHPPIAISRFAGYNPNMTAIPPDKQEASWRSSGPKQAVSGTHLDQPAPRTLISETPSIVRRISYSIAVMFLIGCGTAVWLSGRAGSHTEIQVEIAIIFVLCLLASFMWLSLASPQRLEANLSNGTYCYTDWRAVHPALKFAGTLVRWPFVVEQTRGVLSKDFQGVTERYIASHLIHLIWKDPKRRPILIGSASDLNTARALMEETATKLKLPILEEEPPRMVQ